MAQFDSYIGRRPDGTYDNSGEAGTMAGAFYLKEFVTTKAWVHFDIAGPAFLKSEEGVSPAGGTGIPLRTVFDYLKSL